VHLPANATLTVDDSQTVSTGDTRLFLTPPLPLEKKLHYTFTAQIVRDGKTLTVEKDVPVQAGYQSELSIDFPSNGTQTRTSFFSPEGAAAVTLTPIPVQPAPLVIYSRRIMGSGPPSRGLPNVHYGLDPSDPFYLSAGW
jgi:uncharacterized protein (TIGR03000 family)